MRFLSSPTILRRTARLSFVACATIAFAAAAQANNIRYVSTTGSNANDCTLTTAPCRTLQRGINQTPTGGEVRILDSGDYGNNANIGRSMTISGNGHTVVLGNPITISDAGAKVTLRAMVLNGEGSTVHGIEIFAAAAVHIERCVVHRFTQYGIFQNLANAELFVTDSIARDNGDSGLYVAGTGTTAKVTVDNARFEYNSVGLSVQGSIDAVVTRTVAAGNGIFGISASAGARMTVARTTAAHNGEVGYFVSDGGRMTLESSEAHGSHDGLWAGGGTARISNSVFVNNTYGVRNTGGTVLTRGNNRVSGNTTADTQGTLTPLGGI